MRKFMRTRAAAAPPAPPAPCHSNGHAHKTNGHANGAGVGGAQLDDHSTLSRCDSGSASSAAPWEDPQFPAAARALAPRRRAAADVRWLRPHELCTRPRFRGDDAGPPAAAAAIDADADAVSGSDDEFAARWRIEVGELGDAHVCCAAAALALTPRLLDRVAPPHSFHANAYTGAFRFRFWVFGAWREVAVDDRLPTRGGRPLYSRAVLPDDFTLPLLEKAYAKLYGSYAALRGGSAARALQDLSGGVVQSFSLRRQPRALTFRVLESAVPRATLLVATAAGRAGGGLLAGQAYCVTGLARAGAGALVRMRAVSGRGAWAGAWAPGSAQWRALADADRELLAHPGDFWISFGDFSRSFSRLELVHVGPDDWLAEPALQARRPWHAVLARRRWRPGHNAGGPPHAPTAPANPHFHVQIPRSEAAGARKCHVVVSVTQQYEPGAAADAALHAVGFAVYELSPTAAAAPLADPARAGRRPLDVTHETRAREVVTFFTLPAGRYLVVPHTRRPHTDAAFLLRILTDDRTDVREVNEDNAIVRDVAAELAADARSIPAEVRAAAAAAQPAAGREDAEVSAGGSGARAVRGTQAQCSERAGVRQVDAAALRAALRRVWRACLVARPSLELCRALVALRDAALAGALRARELPALVALLAYWRQAFLRHATPRCAAAPRASSYRLRALLWAAGVTASNKVLEGLVVRFARRASLSAEAYVLALARLHLAHERYRSLDAKIKSNPISLEEMILMTIYS